MKKKNYGASVVIVRDDGAVLLQHRDNIPGIAYPNYWGFPGGGVEDEDIEEAARRELKEETGYIASELNFLHKGIFEGYNGQKVHGYFYWAKYNKRQVIKCFEGQEMRFVNPKDFDLINFLPGFKKIAVKASILGR